MDSINSFGHSITSTVSLLLSLNHLVASKIVLVISFLLSSLQAAVQALAQAVVIILEDLFLFAKETFESVVAACEVLFSIFDSVLETGIAGFLSIKAFFSALFSSISSAFFGVCNGVVYSYESTKDFFCLLGQSVILLLNLVPR